MAYYEGDLDDAAGRAEEVTPHDTNARTNTSRALYIGTGGDLKVTMISGDVATFVNLPDAFILPVRVTHVWDTGTTADDIVSLL